MHATTEQLVSIRDGGPVDVSVEVHVKQCTLCRDELERLATRQRALRELPELKPSPQVFKLLQQRLDAPEIKPKPVVPMWAATAATFVGALALVALMSGPPNQDSGAITAVQIAVDNDNIEPSDALLKELSERSQRLEEVLVQMSQFKKIDPTTSTQEAIDALENRLAILDYAIDVAEIDEYAPEQTERLMQRRVNTLQSLVGLQQAELTRNGYHGFQMVPLASTEQETTW